MRQITGITALKSHRLARSRMSETESRRVKPLPRKTARCQELGIGTVHSVAHARVALSGHVHTNLMGSPGLENNSEQRRGWKCLNRGVVRHRRLSVTRHGKLELVARMPTDGCVNRSC